MYQREAKKARSELSYRAAKRNLSKLGPFLTNEEAKVIGMNWPGVEAKPRKEPPPLIMKRSERGEVHYEELWD